MGTTRLDFLNDFLNDFRAGITNKRSTTVGKGSISIGQTYGSFTNTGVLQSITHFFRGINLMERYGDLDEVFPFCTVDGSEILNRLRCKKKP